MMAPWRSAASNTSAARRPSRRLPAAWNSRGWVSVTAASVTPDPGPRGPAPSRVAGRRRRREEAADRPVRLRQSRIGCSDADAAGDGLDHSRSAAPTRAGLGDQLIERFAYAPPGRGVSLSPQPEQVLGPQGDGDGLLRHTIKIR